MYTHVGIIKISDDIKILKEIGDRLDLLKNQGLENTNEYEKLSDDYQQLAQELVLIDILNDV